MFCLYMDKIIEYFKIVVFFNINYHESNHQTRRTVIKITDMLFKL